MFEYVRNRKARKAREAQARAEAATSTYLAGTGNFAPYGYDGFGAPLSVPVRDEPVRDSDPYNIEERDSLRDEHMTTSQDPSPSYDSSSSNDYSSSSDSSSSYDSSSSGSDSSYSGGSDY